MSRITLVLTCGLLFFFSLLQSGCAEERGFILYPADKFHYLDTAATQYVPAAPLMSPPQLLLENLVSLSWVDVSLAETGFIVLRINIQTGRQDTIAILAPNLTTFVDSTILSPGTYHYSVATLGRQGRVSSYASRSVSFSIPAPVLSFVETGSAFEVTIQWSHNTNLAAKYVIEGRSRSAGDTVVGAHPLVYLGTPASQYVSPVDTNSVYWFRVRSLSSALSNQIELQYLAGTWKLAP
ncbi:MAG: hypothetical protein HYY49_05435 [Ignavibacteriales bacterium]|nr:hypothetical protein [Ignavibacteriales bacterium]